MKVVVFCEGKTEATLRNGLRELVQRRSNGQTRVGLHFIPLDGHMLQPKLSRLVALELENEDVQGVIVLTDVYPNFRDAAAAKAELSRLVGSSELSARLRFHAAQHEVEAWLLPFWKEIVGSLKITAVPPGTRPEDVNHERPPSFHFRDLYRRAKKYYDKVRHAAVWLTADRLEEAAKSCPELKLFLNSLLEFAGVESRL